MRKPISAPALEYIIALLLLIGIPTAWIISSHFEAKAYNRLTGAQTTTWDAMWLELRVQDSPKPQIK